MFNKYVINVAKLYGHSDNAPRYRHHFRIEKDNHPNKDEVYALLAEIKEHYPAPEYNVSLTGIEVTMRTLDDEFDAG